MSVTERCWADRRSSFQSFYIYGRDEKQTQIFEPQPKKRTLLPNLMPFLHEGCWPQRCTISVSKHSRFALLLSTSQKYELHPYLSKLVQSTSATHLTLHKKWEQKRNISFQKTKWKAIRSRRSWGQEKSYLGEPTAPPTAALRVPPPSQEGTKTKKYWQRNTYKAEITHSPSVNVTNEYKDGTSRVSLCWGTQEP